MGIIFFGHLISSIQVILPPICVALRTPQGYLSTLQGEQHHENPGSVLPLNSSLKAQV